MHSFLLCLSTKLDFTVGFVGCKVTFGLGFVECRLGHTAIVCGVLVFTKDRKITATSAHSKSKKRNISPANSLQKKIKDCDINGKLERVKNLS